MAKETAEKAKGFTRAFTNDEWDRARKEGWQKFMTGAEYVAELLRRNERKYRIERLKRENRELRRDFLATVATLAVVRENIADERQLNAEARQYRYVEMEKEIREKIEKERSLGNRLRRAVSHVKGLING